MACVYTADGGARVEQRPLGATGLVVSAVGLGAGRIGDAALDDAAVDRLIATALDAGVTLFDTARSYGLSEERLGRALEGRRERVVLSTKIGYGIEGFEDWTPACIAAGVDAALRRLRTDRLDLVHLHSCPLHVLQRSGVVEALLRAKEAGKVRVAAYSGEGEALRWAWQSGAFGSLQCSVSVVDQGELAGAVREAAMRGIGVLAKRPLGNAPWRFDGRPAEPDVAEAWTRFRALALDPRPLSFTELFARFAAHSAGVSSVLLGTADPAHLTAACAAVAQGPLDEALTARLRDAWAANASGWTGRV
jgi:aryl-alcohol dehydrogenase-like predicted oxidoreductase